MSTKKPTTLLSRQAQRYGVSEHSLAEATLEATADGILVVDLHGKIVRFNDRFVKLWRIPKSVLASRSDDEALAHVLSQLSDPEGFLLKVRELYADHEAESFDVVHFKDGRVFERYSIPQKVRGRPVGRVWSFRDVSDRENGRKSLEHEMTQAHRRLERLDGLWRLIARSDVDRNALTRDVIVEGGRVLGMTSAILAHREGSQLIVDIATEPKTAAYLKYGTPLNQTLSGRAIAAERTLSSGNFLADPEYVDLPTARTLGLKCGIATPFRVGEREFVLSFADNKPRPEAFDDEDRSYVELLAAYFGRVLRLAEQEAQIAYLAFHDSLTDLPNRTRFRERLEELIPQSRRAKRRFALLYVDLDRFKQINDTLGHAAGDDVLRVAAGRLRLITRGGELLARLGGDEFGVLIPELSSPAELAAIAKRLCDSLAEPFRVEHHDFYLSASVGIALFPEDGTTADELFAHVDAAMYRAKDEGRNSYRFYSEQIAERLRARQDIQEGLRQALARGELVLHYQPFVNMESGKLIGAEALLRWQRSDGVLAQPAAFLSVAEESGLMVPIGQWVLREALSKVRSWSVPKNFQLSINVSAAQFADPDFLDRVASAVRGSGINPGMIAIEITESVALQDPEAAQLLLTRCRELGLRIVLDDFGTYYSSLAYLKKLPVDTIKIDRTFVLGLPDSRDDVAIAKSVITLATSLGRNMIAEGVETREQAEWLLANGCVAGQGYLFGRPMPSEDFIRWQADRVELGATGD